MKSLSDQFWNLIDIAEGPDCPLYASRKDHREATMKVMVNSGCFNEEDFEVLFGEQTTPRYVIDWVSERLASLTMQWEESYEIDEDCMGGLAK